jgi:hypothetical protein
MTQFSLAALANGQRLTFNPASDRLLLNGPVPVRMAEVRIWAEAGDTAISHGGKTVWLNGVLPADLPLEAIFAASGASAAFGDGAVGRIGDWYGQSYDLTGETLGYYIDGLGGADLVIGGDGDDWIVGNGPASGPVHVSSVGGAGSPTATSFPGISADGTKVAFFGGWTGFGSASNSSTDVLVRDLTTGQVTNEHKDANGDFGLSGSGRPVISADGSALVFWSHSNLTFLSPAPGSQIYMADTGSGAIRVVSSTPGDIPANGATDYPDVSANGRFVVFQSRATNLAPGSSSLQDDIFLKDTVTGAVTRVSGGLGGGDANADAIDASVSANGRYVAFTSAATNLSANRTGNYNADVYLWDRVTNTRINITGGVGGVFESLNPEVVADNTGGIGYGGIVVFQTGKRLTTNDTNNAVDVYAYDIGGRTFELISATAAGQGVALSSYNPVASGDGRYVAFISGSQELAPGDSNGYADVYVKDRITGEIALVSRLPGVQANQHSGQRLDISLGGEWIVFETSSTNLVGSDGNGGFPDIIRMDNPLFRDVLRGGKGNDTYVLARVADQVVENPGQGIDTVRAAVSYTLGANVENLVLTGAAPLNGTGNGLANVLSGNAGNNVLNGMAGTDTASYAEAAGPVTVNLGLAGAQATGMGNDRLVSIENLAGSRFNDRLSGNGGANRLDGGAGSDTLAGGDGDDTYVVDRATDIIAGDTGGVDTVLSAVNWTLQPSLDHLTLVGAAVNGTGNQAANRIVGTAQANRLTGLAGNDTLDGGGGADTLTGGQGNDTYVVQQASDIIAETFGAGTDRVISAVNWTLGAPLEHLVLTGAAATGGGNAAANRMTGTAGANTLRGYGGADTLDGGGGADILLGGAGADLLRGGLGADRLIGEGGRDVQLAGRDVARDVFVFQRATDSATGAARDVIRGFDRGEDVIDLSAMDPRPGRAGDQALGFNGANGPAARSVWYLDAGANLVVRIDLDGDAGAEMEIQVNGLNALARGDFLL